MKRVIVFLTEPSVTSFGDNVYRPRWLSVLSDYACFFSCGIFKPRRRAGEKCAGDLPQHSLPTTRSKPMNKKTGFWGGLNKTFDDWADNYVANYYDSILRLIGIEMWALFVSLAGLFCLVVCLVYR